MVLITGGTSRNGREVAELLLATKKFRIQLGSRDTSRLAPILLAQGAEGVVLDSISLESMRSALQGVSSVYFIYPALVGSAGDMLVANLFQAAKETPTLTHIVYLSSMRTAPHKEDFELAHKHYLNEQQLIHSGIPFTILRPTYFHENLVDYFAGLLHHPFSLACREAQAFSSMLSFKHFLAFCEVQAFSSIICEISLSLSSP
jgi:uncharacterized protein YbjT (DUF2867 family)